MKKKIIAFLTCVSVIITIFCISTFALEDYVIEEDLILTIDKVTGLSELSNYYVSNTYYKPATGSWAGQYNQVQYIWISSSGRLSARYSTGSSMTSSEVQLNSTLKINSGTTLNTTYQTILQEISNYEPPSPPPPPVYEGALENTNAMFGTTLSVMTVIITWLLANQIALCGLYLYILIACIGIGKRFVKT